MPSGASGTGVLTPGNGLKIIDGLPPSGFVKLSINTQNLNRFYMGSGTSTFHLADVLRWGDVNWSSMEDAFNGCQNLQITAPFPPDLSQVTSTKNMFRDCNSLSMVAGMNGWNMSSVQNMEGMFFGATNFNQNIVNWNTSNVTNMSSMFANASAFNQPIGSWNTSNVTNMALQFYGAQAFNQPIGSWTTNQVNNMAGMFYGASSFNQPIGNWNTANVTNMSGMFAETTSFNQPIGNWNVSSVTNMSNLFFSATAFNQPLESWNVSGVTNMEAMFLGASQFNQPLQNWNVQNVQNLSTMLAAAPAFNQSLGSWTLHPNVDMNFMLQSSGLDCYNYASTLSGWASNNPKVTNRNLGAAGLNFAQFGAPSRNILTNTRGWTITDAGSTNCGEFVTYWEMNNPGGHANQLNFNVGFTDSLQYTWIHVGGSASGTGYFTSQGAQTITGIPTNAHVRLAFRPQNLEHFSINNGLDRLRFYYVERWGNAVWKNMEGMFYGCENPEFITAFGFPNTSQVTSMKNMFRNCTNLLEIGSPWMWDVSSVTDMESMFHGCPTFFDEIGAWNVGNVTNMKSMFEGASQFNWDISQWNVSNVTNFNSMFRGASNFDQWLNDWQTANATDMGSMFFNATIFQSSDLDTWQTSGVTDMSNMFRGATNFNGNVTTWSTDAVTDMSGMFYGATNFNQDISGWTTSAVENMAEMFRGASSFNQELNNWNVGNGVYFSGMFRNAAAFKEDLNNWQTGSGEYFDNMFHGALLFDGEVNTWNTANAITMSGMFASTNNFNREIGSWNVSAVEDLTSMFQNAASFNRDLSTWTFPSATNLSQMFSGASLFNQDLSNWNVSGIHQMIGMFENAGAFNQNLGSWQFFPSVEMNNMLNNSGMDCNNYSATLLGWQTNNPSIMSLNLGANNLEYGILGAQARDILMNNQGWNINGDIEVTNNAYVVQESETLNGQLACAGEFTSVNDPNARLVLIDPNGNAMDFSQMQVVATNDFINPSNLEIIPIPSGASGYYEITDGINTFRVGRRMFKIEVPGNYTTNGGVKVRLYYDLDDFNGMVNDTPPNGNIANYGWFKSATSDFQSTVDQMNASSPQMPLALSMIPVYGNENGVEYVELMVENLSVFGMYAQTIDAPLPVTLTSFNANCDGQNVQLSWSTASEFNASHYVIQSSRDGLIWNDLGEVAAAGSTNQTSNYNFNAQNYGGLTYFRLVQVDLDGAVEIFGPISSNCELENNSMTVYPNPTTDNFTVRIETLESFNNATLELVDMTGRVIMNKTTDIHTGSTLLNFNGSDLKAGTYFVGMKGENDPFAPVRVVRM